MELNYTALREARLSAILRGDMRLSAGLMNRLKWQNALLVNGVPRHTDYPVKPGDTVTAVLDEPTPEYPPEEGELTVLYEDDHILAVDKPAGMLIHPSRATVTGTLANRVIGYYGKTGQRSAFHPVTRLDRDTFGVVLLAKNSYVHEKFRELHNAGKLRKTYHALVWGNAMAEQGIIDAPIARKPLPSLLREIRPDGKPSRTEYRVLWRERDRAMLALTPVTGRTHQLRLHCAYAGFPILGDPQYGDPRSRALSEKIGLTTQLLCAKSISFCHPVTGEEITVTSRMDACKREENTV